MEIRNEGTEGPGDRQHGRYGSFLQSFPSFAVGLIAPHSSPRPHWPTAAGIGWQATRMSCPGTNPHDTRLSSPSRVCCIARLWSLFIEANINDARLPMLGTTQPGHRRISTCRNRPIPGTGPPCMSSTRACQGCSCAFPDRLKNGRVILLNSPMFRGFYPSSCGRRANG